MLILMNHFFSGTEPSAVYRAATGNHRDNALIAKRAGVKVLVLTHLLDQIDQPSVREQIVHEIRQVFDGKVVWARTSCASGCRAPRWGASRRGKADVHGITPDAAVRVRCPLPRSKRRSAISIVQCLFSTIARSNSS